MRKAPRCRLAALLGGSILLAGCAQAPAPSSSQPVKSEIAGKLTLSLTQAAESFEKRRNYAAAVTYYRNLYQRDQQDIGAVVGLSRGLRQLHQLREANAIVLRALKDAPKNVDLRAELGKVQLALGKALLAIDTLSRVDAEIEPKRWDIKVALAMAHDRLGMYEQSERRYRQALEISPENAVVLNNFALSLAQAGRLPEALQMLETAATLPEATPRMRQNLALLYAMKGDLASAERYVRRDMSPEIAEQNMAYYRQLRAGLAAGPQTAPGAAPMAERPAASPPPAAEGVAKAEAIEEPMPAPRMAKAEMAAAKTEAAKLEGADKAERPPEATPKAKPTGDAGRAGAVDSEIERAAAPNNAPPKTPAKIAASTPAAKPAPNADPNIDTKMTAKAATTANPTTESARPDKSGAAAEQAPKTMAKATEPVDAPAEAPDRKPALRAKAATQPEEKKEPDTAANSTGTKAVAMATAVNPAVKGYRLQLGSFRSMEGAESRRATLLREHGDLLRGLDLLIQTVQVPKQGNFFRVNSRPVPNREMVDETCLKLAVRDVPCLLVRVP